MGGADEGLRSKRLAVSSSEEEEASPWASLPRNPQPGLCSACWPAEGKTHQERAMKSLQALLTVCPSLNDS